MTSLPRLTIPHQTTLQVLSEIDTMPVFRATHKIWSAGLGLRDYLSYNESQQKSIWGKKNLSLVGIKDNNGEVVTNCKLYQLNLHGRGKEYRFYGIGAVYTRAQNRHQGLASDMLEELVEQALAEDIDGLLLFSDIGADFYNSHGFYPLGAASFTLHLPGNLEVHQQPIYQVELLKDSDIDFLQRHYQQWLSRQPFGVIRDQFYWHYKINKEAYLSSHSRLSWPALICLTVPGKGYAILEKGGATLRLLEIGAIEQESLWHCILDYAIKSHLRQLRGWEGVLAELAPGFALDRYLQERYIKSQNALKLEFSERAWGAPMLLPLNPIVEDWLDNNPCPLLELDHL